MKLDQVSIDNYSTLVNLSVGRKMLLTITQEVATLLEELTEISIKIKLESSYKNAKVFKEF